MSHKLSPSIIQYIEGANARDVERACSGFADDAVVHDENRDHVGRSAIRAWMEDSASRYATRLVVVEGSSESADATMVAVRVSGTFPGSPIVLQFVFQLADGLISHLDIRP